MNVCVCVNIWISFDWSLVVYYNWFIPELVSGIPISQFIWGHFPLRNEFHVISSAAAIDEEEDSQCSLYYSFRQRRLLRKDSTDVEEYRRKTIPYEMLCKITSLRHSRLSSAIHHFANCMCVCQGRSNFRDCYYVYTGPCECSLAVQTNNMASVFSGWVNVCYLQKHFLCLLLLCSFQFPAKRYFTNKLPRPPVFNWWRQRVPPTETREEMNILLWHVWQAATNCDPHFNNYLRAFSLYVACVRSWKREQRMCLLILCDYY